MRARRSFRTTMRAFAIDKYGETGALRDLPAPVPGPDEVLVRIRAAGVNPVDWKLRDQISRIEPRTFPVVLGQDFAGVVERTGRGVTGFSAGDRVFGISRGHGAYAEYTVLPVNDQAQPIARIPDDLSDAEAAALPTPGLTALAGIEMLGVTSGTTLLVVGASGAVGGYAVQMARARNAHVIGTASSRHHAEVEALGAQEVIDYDRADTVAAVRSAHPGGIGAVLDLATPPDGIERIATVLRPGGRIASAIRAVDEGRLADRGIRGMNIGMARTPQSSPEGLAQLAALVRSGVLSVRLQRELPLAEAAAALESSKAGKIMGKVVLLI